MNWLFAVLVLSFPAYVLSVERVVAELVKQPQRGLPLRVDLEVAQPGAAPFPAIAELHPDWGVRVRSEGGRWLFAANAPTRGSAPTPPWVPELRPLVLGDSDALLEQLARLGVALGTSELARCGDSDCIVLGGRNGRTQVWVDKDRGFRVLRMQRGAHRASFDGFREWDSELFPEFIHVADERGEIGTLRVRGVAPARGLGEDDFSAAWVETEPRAP